MLTRRDCVAATMGAAVASLAPSAVQATPSKRDAIARENAKPGTTDWLLTKIEPVLASGEDDLYKRRRAIEGYCSHASIAAGETLTVFVSAQPASEFRLDVFRMGHYGGKGGRLVHTAKSQAGPQAEPVEGAGKLMEARWQPSLTIKIPRDWQSGVYLGKLTTLVTGYEAYVVFIVRDDRKADYLFQCSDITWQAYNRWPAWRSLYDWNDNRWHTNAAVGATVGFDRPYGIYYNGLPSKWNPLTNGSGEFLLWEFPLAFWMEEQGYDVTYISNLDTHRNANGLLRARGFLSIGHDEYWTEAMIKNVVRARDAGVNLAFLSGNAVDSSVTLGPSSDGRADRTFARKARLTDEQELMGVASYGVGAGPFVCQAPDHWVFAGTGMKKGDEIHDLVGWEFHGPPTRGDDKLVVLAGGPVFHENWKMGEHAAVIYPGPKGNFVFNAGTCWWNMPLSSPPGKVNPPFKNFSKPDARVQRITKNLFDRMIASSVT